MHFTKYKSLAFAFIIALTANSIFAQNESAGVERYGLYIGSNDGGKSHQRLLYAGSDAISFQKIMTDIGGISKSNGILLLDPTKEDVDNAFEIISDMMQKKKMEAKRSEFVFYYSGHSDENSLLLGKTSYDYSSLKAAISNVPSDVHVVILDSCFSGNFIRTKGGQKQKPFLIDDSSVVKGHAYLSSSSSQESSQESDEIGSSFFTNAMITGLRGAADTSGDKKVTLNELYSYAFNETLSKTENTADPQHPNYNITLVGSGDLVLSDVSSSDCILTISRELTGRVIVRDKNGKLVSEINKITQTPIYLALEEGSYGVTVIGEHSTLQGSFVLGPQKNYALSTSSLSQIARVENRTRGDETGEEPKEEPQEIPTEESDIIDKPFVFSFVCNEFEKGQNEKTKSIISLALLRSRLFRVDGAMISGIGNEAQIVNGVQTAYAYNMAEEMVGVQWSNIFNYSGSLTGVQSSGILNIATGEVKGLQGTGIANIASEDFKGVQAAGIVNTAANNFKGLQAAGILNLSKGEFVGLQGAGIVNAAAGNFTGLQGAGMVNVNVGDFKGLQAAPFVNVTTGNVKGVQLGLFNFCKGECDLQIGLLNYSKNGVFELSVSYTTDEKIRLTLNTGGKYIYSIFGAYINPRYSELDKSERVGHVVFGLGSRIRVWKFNFDFELMANEIIFSENKENTKWYPSGRVAAGFTPIKHLNVFAGFTLAYQSDGNEGAFVSNKKRMVIYGNNGVALYPEFDVGLKLALF